MSEFTALCAAVIVGAIIAVSAAGDGVLPLAESILTHKPHADFSAKFIKP